MVPARCAATIAATVSVKGCPARRLAEVGHGGRPLQRGYLSRSKQAMCHCVHYRCNGRYRNSIAISDIYLRYYEMPLALAGDQMRRVCSNFGQSYPGDGSGIP